MPYEWYPPFVLAKSRTSEALMWSPFSDPHHDGGVSKSTKAIRTAYLSPEIAQVNPQVPQIIEQSYQARHG